MKYDKYHYYRNFQIALIFSLILIIFSLKIFTQKTTNDRSPVFPPENIITLADIPLTTQSESGYEDYSSLPLINLNTITLDDPQILPDLEINSESGKSNSNEIASSGVITNETGSNILNALPFIPRQTLEVIPEKVENAEGIVILKILIGGNGIPVRHIILFNSTDNQMCAINVLTAVYKSRWKPVVIDDTPVEFWLEKSYTFGK